MILDKVIKAILIYYSYVTITLLQFSWRILKSNSAVSFYSCFQVLELKILNKQISMEDKQNGVQPHKDKTVHFHAKKVDTKHTYVPPTKRTCYLLNKWKSCLKYRKREELINLILCFLKTSVPTIYTK